jgi:hypothetical protein
MKRSPALFVLGLLTGLLLTLLGWTRGPTPIAHTTVEALLSSCEGGKLVELQGRVRPGSIQELPGGYRFEVAPLEGGEPWLIVPVYSPGLIPDTLWIRSPRWRAGQGEEGNEVQVTGVLRGDGTLEAERVLAKCP